MHKYRVPHAGRGCICLEQISKRLKQMPDWGNDPDKYLGWGMHFVEGPHFTKMYTILGIALAVDSILFGVLYWYFLRDI